MSDLAKCCVDIRDPNTSVTLGTGFIVTDDGYIVTCYHVIEKSVTEKKIGFVNIHFPYDPDELEAQIVENYCNSVLDIAVLKIEGKLSPNTEVANIGTLVSEDSPFRTFGFRKNKTFNGLHSGGKIYGMVKKIKDNIELIQLSSSDIEKGMSGSPVFDVKNNKIVGVISEIWETPGYVDKDLAFAIPISSLILVFRELKIKNSSLSKDLDQIDNNSELKSKLKSRSEAQIRSQNEVFVGRDAEIKKIRDLVNTHNIINVTGLGGIGKTSLVLQIIKEFKNSPVISFSVFPEITTDWVIDQFNNALNTAHRNLNDLLSGLEQLGLVFVHVDDYELISNFKFSSSSPNKDIRAIHDFLKLLPNNIRLFVTSRNSLNDFDLAYNFKISGLNENDGIDLFLKLTHDKHIGKVDNLLKENVRKIIQEIEVHPLAIKLLSGSYNGGGIEELNSIYENIMDIKNNLEYDMKYRSLKSCFNYSFKRLPNKKKELLLQLATFNSPISEDAFLYVFSEKFSDLNILKISHFIKQFTVYNNSDEKVIFDFHNLIRKFIEEKSKKLYPDIELRITNYYRRFVDHTIQKLENGDFGIHVQVLQSILGKERNDVEPALNRINNELLRTKYLDKLAVILSKLRYLSKSFKVRLQCIELDYASSNFSYLADDYREISSLHNSIREFSKATEFGEMSLSTYILMRDNYKIATQLVNLSFIYMRSENLPQADLYLGMTHLVLPQGRDDKFNSIYYSCSASLYCVKKDYDNAIKFYTLGKELAEKKGWIDEIANDLRNMGVCHRFMGRIELAEKLFKDSLKVSLSIDDPVGAQRAYISLSKIPSKEGKDYYEKKIKETNIEIKRRGMTFTYIDQII